MINVNPKFSIWFILLIQLLFFQCNPINEDKRIGDMEDAKYSYQVKQSTEPHDIKSVWDDEIWNKSSSLVLTNFMGDKPAHFPETQVKLRYDKEHIYVIFNVRDRYVKAVAKEANGKVWQDSCVEFFFSPGPDVERGYFNLEANCKGVFLLEYHTDNDQGFVSRDDYKKIKIAHSLTKDVEQESTEPVNWTVEYSIPISILSKYMKVDKPEPGVTWRANFYKCADKTSHPHWLTWAQVDYPKPKFHLPEFFGQLNFE